MSNELKRYDVMQYADTRLPDNVEVGMYESPDGYYVLHSDALAAIEAAGKAQHDRDSVELRNLCQARDDARRERDLLKVDVAALETSVVHIGRLLDDARRLLCNSMTTMKALHESMQPDENTENIDAIVPGAAVRKFVDDNAALIHAIRAAGHDLPLPQKASR